MHEIIFVQKYIKKNYVLAFFAVYKILSDINDERN